MSVYRLPGGKAEAVTPDPFPAPKVEPTEAEREADRARRLKVAAAAIHGSSWPMRSASEDIVTSRYGGKYEPSLEKLEAKVDEAIAVMLVAIEQWRAAR